MEKQILTLLKDVRYESTLIVVLILTVECILKQSGFTENEMKIIKENAPEKIHRQKSLKVYKAMDFVDNK